MFRLSLSRTTIFGCIYLHVQLHLGNKGTLPAAFHESRTVPNYNNDSAFVFVRYTAACGLWRMNVLLHVHVVPRTANPEMCTTTTVAPFGCALES